MITLLNEPLMKHTTLKIGGRADRLLIPENEEELIGALAEPAAAVLGFGSNVLAADSGVRGTVVVTTALKTVRLAGGNTIYAECGAALASVAAFCRREGLCGFEFAAGIPGTVGGACVMNAGAYGGEMKDVVSRVRVLRGGVVEVVERGDCGFGYRSSAFGFDSGAVVLAAELSLSRGLPDDISRRMGELAAKRRSKQPSNLPSAGSAFKRPAPLPNGTPLFAAELIERCGLKGFSVGGASISEKHAGFAVNTGGATAQDFKVLLSTVASIVRDKTGVTLEPEIKFVGSDLSMSMTDAVNDIDKSNNTR